MTELNLGFIPKPFFVPLDNLLPSRVTPMAVLASRKFQQIRSSIEDVGVIEPFCVLALDRRAGGHLLLDGHLRKIILRDLGAAEAECLIAKDDEAYTYNNYVSRLSTIQEHMMVRRAIERGISAERLAKNLTIHIDLVRKRTNLLDGICDEVAVLLKDRNFSLELAPLLRKMKPTRQVECVELMISANKVTTSYARALLTMTRPELLADNGASLKKRQNATADQIARMDNEMSKLEEQYRIAEKTYSEDVLNLTIACRYVGRLLNNKGVMNYLQVNHPDVLGEFSHIVETAALDA